VLSKDVEENPSLSLVVLRREIKHYESLLGREFGEGEKSLEVVWSIGIAAGKAVALQTPAAAADLVATTAEGLTAAPGALRACFAELSLVSP
jgi:hypothetical protein